MKEIKGMVSVIVPFYNREKFLKNCIESLINQTYKNIEIILVDDGSTDSSRKICEKYAKKYSSVKLIPKNNNEGVVRARKAGSIFAMVNSLCLWTRTIYQNLIWFKLQSEKTWIQNMT